MSIFESLSDLERRREPAALCIVVRTRGSVPRHVASMMIVHPGGSIEGTVGGGEMESRVVREALQAIETGQPHLVQYALVDPAAGDPGVCGGEMEVFVVPLRPQPRLLVIGAGHVGRAIVHLGKWLGFHVTVADERADLCTPEAAPGADEYLPVGIAELPARYRFDAATYIVMPTHGVALDVEGLPHLIEMPHAYLGVIGSRRRWATAVRRLVEKGVPRDKLEGVHAPMGLELHAETPEEIALSVLSEILMVRNRASGDSMKWLGEGDESR